MNRFYPYRHLLAGFVAILGFLMIQKIAAFLYFSPYINIQYMQMAKMFWYSGNWFFRLLILMNFVIKPLLLYYLTIFIFSIQRKK